VDSMIYTGDVMGKPRMTHKDRWEKRPATTRYWAFKDNIKLQARQQGFQLADQYMAKVFIKMPKSWSKKKKESMYGKPHRQKPDWDNIAKGIQDALLEEDSSVWFAVVLKCWWHESKIILENLPEKLADTKIIHTFVE